MQIYFLSILFNALSGIVLLMDSMDSDAGKTETGLFNSPGFRLILGAASAVTGLLKLLAVVPGNVPVAGDLLPAAGGLAAGFVFVYEFYREKKTIGGETPKLVYFINQNKKVGGIGLILFAVLHFLFPQALFL